jgi:hypothetical protein
MQSRLLRADNPLIPEGGWKEFFEGINKTLPGFTDAKARLFAKFCPWPREEGGGENPDKTSFVIDYMKIALADEGVTAASSYKIQSHQIKKLSILNCSDEWFSLTDLCHFLESPAYWPMLRSITIEEYTFPEFGENQIEFWFLNKWDICDKMSCLPHARDVSVMYCTCEDDTDLLDSILTIDQVGTNRFQYDCYKRYALSKDMGGFSAYKKNLIIKASEQKYPVRFYTTMKGDIRTGGGGSMKQKGGDGCKPIPTHLPVLTQQWDLQWFKWYKKIPRIVAVLKRFPAPLELNKLAYLSPKVICLFMDHRKALDLLNPTPSGLLLRDRGAMKKLGFFFCEPRNSSKICKVEIDSVSGELHRLKWLTETTKGGSRRFLIPPVGVVQQQ